MSLAQVWCYGCDGRRHVERSLEGGRIWLCTQPTDMRCSFDGLSARVRRSLGLAGLGLKEPPSRDDVPTQTVSYERRAKVRDAAVAESGLRFGPEVPVQTIEVTDPTIDAIPQAEREVIGEKVSYRLAQQPGSYVVLKYVRPVVKRRGTETMLTAPAPVNVLERSCADVSFLGAMLIDKFCWHLPLYRQHQRLLDAGITLSRSTVVYWTSGAIDLLAPLADAQSAHGLASGVLAMDETSLKAGRAAKGKMRTGWLCAASTAGSTAPPTGRNSTQCLTLMCCRAKAGFR